MTQLDPDALPPGLTTVRVRPRSNDSMLVTGSWMIAVLVGVAVLKPWGAGSPAPTRAPVTLAPTSAPVTPAPTEDRTAEGLATEFCLGAGGWQVASLETWQTQDVRVWRAIQPISDVTGPADPAIPAVPIVALEIAALGWCAPAYGPERPVGPATVTAWDVRDGIVTELGLHQVHPASGVTELGALYVPLTKCTEQTQCVPLLPEPVPGPWVTGRVVFRYLDEGSGIQGWHAVDVVILPSAESPLASPPALP